MRPFMLATAGFMLPFAAPAFAAESPEGPPSPTAAASDPETAKAPKKKSEWEFKPRWRLQYDFAHVDGPAGLVGTGNSEEIRRAQLGVDIKMPGGFSARIEGEFTADPVELVDAYLAWNGDGINVTAGQHKFFSPLDDMTSDLNTSFTERAALVTAFNFSRRTGLSAGYVKGDFQVNAGIGTDPLIQLNDVDDNSISAHVRTVWMPQLGKAKLHFAAAYHWRDRKDSSVVPVRYRQRPLVHSTETRYVATPNLLADREQTYGVEAAAVNGPFHFASEAYWHHTSRPAGSDPTFFGAYAEAGFFLTKGDSRPLKGGQFGAIKPKKALGDGGIGAVQINARYDYLDLNSGGVVGGTQRGYLASLVWTPTTYLKLIAEYARLDYRNAAIAVAGDRDYSVDVIGARVQLTY
ncbi:OprO/OprP family phosphate-selective porin [Sphingopyxis sp.]|uniref:OprO/OprP family phosphate-selective porin n=1 Tax=Sphingopyxis sp. TaxID=1908224 RepID=UPI003D0BDFED